jgi:hypothetical protein
MHKKRLVGTHFLRLVSLDTVFSSKDIRVYVDPEKAPLNLEKALDLFDQRDELFPPGFAVQVFTKFGVREVEDLSRLYYGVTSEKPTLTVVAVPTKQYKKVIESVKRCGVGYSFSKESQRRDIQMYYGKPHEFVCGLPLRPYQDLGVYEGLPVTLDGPCKAGVEKYLKKGLSFQKAMRESIKDYHVSQGRCRESEKGCLRPLANCAHCGKREPSSKSFKMCGACRIPAYCSKACAEADWPNHIAFCKAHRSK